MKTQRVRKTALITGASYGIGRIFAERLAQRGMDTVLVARSTDKLEQLTEELTRKYGTQSLVISADLSQPGIADVLYQRVRNAGWKVDWLVNNAGISRYGSFDTMPPEDIEKMLMIHVVNLAAITRRFIPTMLAQDDGVIINVASALGYVPMPWFGAYAAAKSFIIAFSEALWAEYRRTGVHVFTLSPGVTKTGMIDELPAESPLSRMKAQPAEDVVDSALRSIDRKHGSLITGFNNKMLAAMPRILPRTWVARIVTRIAQPTAPQANSMR